MEYSLGEDSFIDVVKRRFYYDADLPDSPELISIKP